MTSQSKTVTKKTKLIFSLKVWLITAGVIVMPFLLLGVTAPQVFIGILAFVMSGPLAGLSIIYLDPNYDDFNLFSFTGLILHITAVLCPIMWMAGFLNKNTNRLLLATAIIIWLVMSLLGILMMASLIA